MSLLYMCGIVAAYPGAFFMFSLVCSLIVCLADPVCHSDHLDGEKRAGYFAFLWFTVCVLSVLVCLLFFLVSLVGYVL